MDEWPHLQAVKGWICRAVTWGDYQKCPTHCMLPSGMDIIPQKYGTEISDHWPLTARLCLGVSPVRKKNLPRPRRDQLLRGHSLCLDSSYAAASGAKNASNVTDLQMEQNLAVNQLAGRRQQLAPEVLNTPDQLISLQKRRAEQKRLLARVTAKSAKEAAERVQFHQD